MMAAYEILIADDHPLFRSALRQALTLSLGNSVRLVETENIAELESCLQEKIRLGFGVAGFKYARRTWFFWIGVIAGAIPTDSSGDDFSTRRINGDGAFA